MPYRTGPEAWYLWFLLNKIKKGRRKKIKSEIKARRRRSTRLSSERGDETETREEAYGDPIPQNVNFLD